MTDQLDKLKKAFSEAPEIKASSKAKQAAIQAAMQAFDAEKVSSHQGNDIDNRLKEQDNKKVDLFTFSKWRESMKLTYILPGAAALAAIALVAVNTYQFRPVYTGESSPAIAPQRTDELTANVKKEKLADTSRKLSETKLAMQESVSVPQSAPATISRLAKVIHTRKARSVSAEDMLAMPELESIQPPQFSQQGNDKFETIVTSPLKLTQQQPVSTFSIDVDTSAYSFMRASLNQGQLPQKDAVRVEELINYFPYDYPAAADQQVPFKVNTTVMPSPWNENTRLLHIGIRGYDLPAQENPHSNLVFLLDTSGSMNAPNKLPLLLNSFKLLLTTLNAEDTVAIVAYAGSAGTVLEPTKVQNRTEILNALSQLSAGGSTAGGEGIELAYQLAEASFDSAAVNRVILATDGDFNVGISDPEALKSFVERKRATGVYLSVLGFGAGNYNDALMQTLAQNGNGNAAYIDSLSEARKVLVEEASSTLFTIAKDVKIQMEFNPVTVSEYRLIGYETRQLNREDFNNDKVDAGEIGSGHTVTAIYEITPAESTGRLVDDLRYQAAEISHSSGNETEYGYLKLRYKLPQEDVSQLIKRPVRIEEQLNSVKLASPDARFATAVAAYGQILRGGTYTRDYGYDDVIALAQTARGEDPFGYRSEFVSLVRLAKSIDSLQVKQK